MSPTVGDSAGERARQREGRVSHAPCSFALRLRSSKMFVILRATTKFVLRQLVESRGRKQVWVGKPGVALFPRAAHSRAPVSHGTAGYASVGQWLYAAAVRHNAVAQQCRRWSRPPRTQAHNALSVQEHGIQQEK